MRHNPALRTLALVVLTACTSRPVTLALSPARALDADEPEGFHALASGGPLPHTAVVRAINRFDAAVPSPLTEQITVDDVPITLQFDGYGYGTIAIDTPGVSIIGGAVERTEIVAIDSAWPDLPMQEAWEIPMSSEPTFGAAIHTGMVLASGTDVWWAGEGAAAHRVLSVDDEILGLRTGSIDLDGVSDALVWTSDTLFLLKGRANGGLGWGGAFEAEGYEIASADMGDLSGDNLPDLAIAWVDPSGDGLFDVLEGDGLFRFTAAVPRDLSGRPTSIIIGDQTGEGLAQATILLDDGTWARFIEGADQRYMPIGPRAPTTALTLPEGSTLLHSGDINGDGAGEIAIASRRIEGEPRSMWFIDVATDAYACIEDPDDEEAQCATEFLPLENEPGAWVSIADGNGDFYDDIFLAHDNRVLYAVALDPLEVQGRYGEVRVLDLPAYGPIDLLDTDRDGGADLLLSAERVVWRWRGIGYDFGDLQRFWEPIPAPAVPIRDGLLPPFLLAELDNDDDTIEIIAFGLDGGSTELRILTYTPGTARADLLDEIEVDEAGRTPDDLVLCDNDLYFVIGGEVVRVAVTNPDSLPTPVRAGSDATRVDCGDGPDNGDVAVIEGGEVQLRTRLSLAAVGQPIADGAFDVAIGDIGDGPEIASCDTQGCSIVWWSDGNDAAFVRSYAGGTTLEGADERTLSTVHAGQLLVSDIDRDGNVDLVGIYTSGPEETSSARVTLLRSSDGVFLPAVLHHLSTGWSRTIGVYDGDGDGIDDLWGIDAAGDLVFLGSAPESTSR